MITAVTSPARTTPSRKRAGRRNRSDRIATQGYTTAGLRLGGDLVADAPDRHDRAGVAELAPQLANVDVDGPRVAREGVAPDPLEQLVARQHEAAMVEELPEQVELLGGELHLLAGDGHLTAARVDGELAVARARRSRGAAGTARRDGGSTSRARRARAG